MYSTGFEGEMKCTDVVGEIKCTDVEGGRKCTDMLKVKGREQYTDDLQ